jgi:23S rRNA-/tRNA-specific pseudouridylate synthase
MLVPGSGHAAREPIPVHRLDQGTSGVLLLAKAGPRRLNVSEVIERRVETA